MELFVPALRKRSDNNVAQFTVGDSALGVIKNISGDIFQRISKAVITTVGHINAFYVLIIKLLHKLD